MVTEDDFNGDLGEEEYDGSDVLARVTLNYPDVAARLRHLDEAAKVDGAAAHAALGAVQEAQDLRHAKARVAEHLRKAKEDHKLFRENTSRDGQGRLVVERAPDDARLRRAEQELEAAEKNLTALRETQAKKAAQRNASVKLSGRCVRYVARNKLLKVDEDDAPTTGIRKLDAFAPKVRELRAVIKKTHRAPLPAEARRQRAVADVDRLAAHAAPLVKPNGDVGFPMQTVHGVEAINGFVSRVHDGVALVAWLFRDELVQKLTASIPDDAAALGDQEREQKLRTLRAELFALERDEELMLRREESAGKIVRRRADADPRAVLGLSASMPPPEN